jgi:hypothetical protein
MEFHVRKKHLEHEGGICICHINTDRESSGEIRASSRGVSVEGRWPEMNVDDLEDLIAEIKNAWEESHRLCAGETFPAIGLRRG